MFGICGWLFDLYELALVYSILQNGSELLNCVILNSNGEDLEKKLTLTNSILTLGVIVGHNNDVDINNGFCPTIMDQQASLFVATMKNNCTIACML